MLRSVTASIAGKLLRPSVPGISLVVRGEKTTTNIVGLDFDPNARQNLISACNEVLSSVAQHIPAGVLYRDSLEKTIAYKLKVLELNPENGAAEEVLGFQLEQETAACKKELTLIPKMAGWPPLPGCGGRGLLCTQTTSS